MDTMNVIMVVLPFEPRLGPAVHRACTYARRSGAVLHLCLFDHYAPIDHAGAVFGLEVSERARRDFLDERLHWLSRQAAGLAAQGLRVECDVIWAPDASKAIVEKALAIHADLVLKDVGSEAGEHGHLKPAAVDWKLLRLCPAPLMLLRAQAALLPQRFVAAIDVGNAAETDALNQRLLADARACAALSHASLHLASVFCCVPMAVYDSGFIADTYEIMDAAHRQSLAAFAQRHQIAPGQVLRAHAVETADGIATLAERVQADLLVIGSAYHSGLDRLIFGTTAEALIRRLGCDVLLVKPAGFDVEARAHLHLDEAAAPEAASLAIESAPMD